MNFIFDNERPIYVQLVEQLQVSIVSGKLKPGDRLPSVREFALQSKVNPNTMQKALSELEDLGLIYTERTNGKFVTEDVELIREYKEKCAKEKAQKFFADMRELGFGREDAAEYLRKLGGSM